MSAHSKDRISEYLKEGLHEIMFGELSSDYLNRIGAAEFLEGVPVPLKNADGGNEQGIEAREIVFDMGRVIGADPDFVYAKQYMEFIGHAAGETAEPMLVSEAARLADASDFESACMMLRAALRINPNSRNALFLYGRVCKECQARETEDEERAANYKAEAMEAFELLSIMHPEFALGHYYLGYEYLNLGLYLKTKLTWQDFMKYSSGEEADKQDLDLSMLSELRDDISVRLEELEDPIRIEEACNKIMTGDYQGGKDVLDEYREGSYSKWWPLWYYLGTAETALGHTEKAKECFKTVLTYSPSNTDAMEELAAIYALSGDEESAAKYRNKIRIVKQNAESE